jgi:hypothetical protein
MPKNATLPKTAHFDVPIAGAGISGIGGAYHLTKQCPDKSFGCTKFCASTAKTLAGVGVSPASRWRRALAFDCGIRRTKP